MRPNSPHPPCHCFPLAAKELPPEVLRRARRVATAAPAAAPCAVACCCPKPAPGPCGGQGRGLCSAAAAACRTATSSNSSSKPSKAGATVLQADATTAMPFPFLAAPGSLGIWRAVGRTLLSRQPRQPRPGQRVVDATPRAATACRPPPCPGPVAEQQAGGQATSDDEGSFGSHAEPSPGGRLRRSRPPTAAADGSHSRGVGWGRLAARRAGCQDPGGPI